MAGLQSGMGEGCCAQMGLVETTRVGRGEAQDDKMGFRGWDRGFAFHCAVHTHTGRRMIPRGLPEKGREVESHLQDEASPNKWQTWGSCQDAGPPSLPCQVASGPPSNGACQGLVGLGTWEGVLEETWAPLSLEQQQPLQGHAGDSTSFLGSWLNLISPIPGLSSFLLSFLKNLLVCFILMGKQWKLTTMAAWAETLV